ncbi:MAG: hypothetical protein ACXVPQ_01760, partial [Bacteroidia bacterium]
YKRIPAAYESAILTALSHFPELKGVRIAFMLKADHAMPCSTRPSLKSLMRKTGNRTYSVVICEETKSVFKDVLLKNLPFRARLGMIGHELAHIVQYESCSRAGLLAMLLKHAAPALKRQTERAADQATIDHGLGNELYALAAYIRRSAGYLRKNKVIRENYLKPAEIRESLP